MTANRKIKRALKLDELEEQGLEAIGQTPGVTLELNNGETINIPHPMLVTDEQQEQIDHVNSGRDVEEIQAAAEAAGEANPKIPAQSVRFARALLGDEEFDRFKAGGGKATHVQLAWALLTKDLQEKGPKLPR